jgi:hypothetical protein
MNISLFGWGYYSTVLLVLVCWWLVLHLHGRRSREHGLLRGIHRSLLCIRIDVAVNVLAVHCRVVHQELHVHTVRTLAAIEHVECVAGEHRRHAV